MGSDTGVCAAMAASSARCFASCAQTPTRMRRCTAGGSEPLYQVLRCCGLLRRCEAVHTAAAVASGNDDFNVRFFCCGSILTQCAASQTPAHPCDADVDVFADVVCGPREGVSAAAPRGLRPTALQSQP